MDINYKLIGRRISDIRKNNGMTQEELAEICDVSSRFISDVENGKKRASLKTLVSISDALSISMDDLIFGFSHTPQNQSGRWNEVVKDCNLNEMNVLIETAAAMKKAMRKHQVFK